MPSQSSSPSMPKTCEKVLVKDFYKSFKKQLQLKLVAGERGLSKTILEKSMNRPALALTGYFKYFARKRLQLFGAGEMSYLRNLGQKGQVDILTKFCEKKVPCIVVSRNLSPTKAMIKVANKYKIPLFRTSLSSKDFSAEATVLLEDKMAPRTTLYGTLLDIKGVGTIIRGKSGVGKSECALALIDRGHSLITDDVVHLKLVADHELRGRAPKLGRNYMECRGLGIINIAELFGIRAIRLEKRIDFVVTFLEWNASVHEERTGLEQSFFTILGQEIPHVEIPVRPGRDMARLVEVASMVQSLKKIGHDSAKDFNQQLIKHMTKK